MVMKKKLVFLMLGFSILYSACYGQKKSQLDSTEKECILMFHNFLDYIKHDKMNSEGITGDAAINYILLNYLYIDRQLDSTGKGNLGETVFREGELKRFKRELMDFARYFLEKSDAGFIDSIQIIPLRLSKDTFIYDRMTKFQKKNTYVVYHNSNPDKALFYMLFIPPIKDRISEPRIWSWKLGYQYGKFMFTSPNGKEGYELIFP